MGGVSHFSINSGRSSGQSAEKSFADLAVLYRLKSQAEFLKIALERRGIPCQLVGSPPFFMNSGLKQIYYWLQAAAGNASVAEHISLLQGLKGFGSKAVAHLEKMPLNTADFFQEAVKQPMAATALKILNRLQADLRKFQEGVRNSDIASHLPACFKLLAVRPDPAEAQKLIEMAGIFGHDLRSFAAHLKENTRATVYDERAEAVSLMTLHSAKGLEFPVVFICGLEEGVLPYNLEGRSCDLEEERRLFYVGMTRAGERLILTSAASRIIYGRKIDQQPSRFVNEVPAGLLKTIKSAQKKPKKPTARQLSLF